MSYNQFIDAYNIEAIWGTSTITAVGDTTYTFGAVLESSFDTVVTERWDAVGVNTREVSAGNVAVDKFDTRVMVPIIVQNGIPLWAALGKSSTAGGGPYTHTITPTDDGSDLPSFTLNQESKGTATAMPIQATGCKLDRLTLTHDMERTPFLMARMDFLAELVQDGISLTNSPILPPTLNASEFVTLTRTFNSVAIDGLISLEIEINNGLIPVYAKTWDTGTYTGYHPKSIREDPRIQYEVRLVHTRQTIEDDMFDALVGRTQTHDAVFKWTRSATDYIQITCTDCTIIKGPLGTPRELPVREEIVMRPRAMSVTVVDSIAGATYYGE